MDAKEKLRQVFRDVFGIAPEQFNLDLSPATLPQWDSFSHLVLYHALEKTFGIELTIVEILGISSAVDILHTLKKKGVEIDRP